MKVETLHSRIGEYTKELKLPGIHKYYQEETDKAVHDDLGYGEYLVNVLEREYILRLENRKVSRIRRAGFPYKKYLEELEVDSLPDDARKKFKGLKSLEFIRSGQNVILAGNPGTGKTHLAIGLGIKACMNGYKVLFTTVPTLITQLKESRSEKVLRACHNKFESYDLVICDEFGYISFDKEGAELLFTHLSLRAGRKSIIVTTNLSFDRWQELFGDPVLTAAMVDRLTHKAYIVNMNGNSYRLKETQEWITSL
jgi:DNA replication protein DnaC